MRSILQKKKTTDFCKSNSQSDYMEMVIFMNIDH